MGVLKKKYFKYFLDFMPDLYIYVIVNQIEKYLNYVHNVFNILSLKYFELENIFEFVFTFLVF